MNKKGFFFTVVALVLLSFIFISIELWAQTISLQEQRYANKFDMYAMKNAIRLSEEQVLEDFTKASLVYAMDKLAVSIQEHPDKSIRGIYDTKNKKASDPNLYTGDSEGIYYLNRSIYELMTYGNTSGYLTDKFNTYPPKSYFYISNSTNLTYTKDERKYTLKHYFETTKNTSDLIGYDISWGNPQNFTLNQTGTWEVAVSFNVQVNFSNKDKTIMTSKNLSINTTFDINGMADPYITRAHVAYLGNSADFNSNVPRRNIYHAQGVYDERDDAQAIPAKNGPEGLGWFFGPVVMKSDIDDFSVDNYRLNLSKISQYILMTNDVSLAIDESDRFGGIILLATPGLSYAPISSIIKVVENTTHYCAYRQVNQTNCIFCLKYYVEVPDPNGFRLGCSAMTVPSSYNYVKNASIIASSIPKNPSIPYIVPSGLPSSYLNRNYHLNLPEYLISNEFNYSEMCSINCNNQYFSQFQATKMGAYDNHQIWDMTGPRDMASCGFYVASEYGPTYLQRFLALSSYDGVSKYSSKGFGIESFNVGGWAGGWNDPKVQGIFISTDDLRSRIDYHYYSEYSGYGCIGPQYLGMPGCRSQDMCSISNTNAKLFGAGWFSMTNKEAEDPAKDYSLDELAKYTSGSGESTCR